MRRVLLAAVAALVFVPGAQGWTWPSDGSVLRPFVLGDDPYAGGQHRGVDIGGELGADVRAAASGSVSFAGTVPGGGKTITIQTADGYAVTLLQLGQILVVRGQVVEEGAVVARVGPSGDEVTVEPHVHLGVRVASDPHAYLDPLTLLPAREPSIVEPEAAEAPLAVGQAPASEQPAAGEAPGAEDAAPAEPFEAAAASAKPLEDVVTKRQPAIVEEPLDAAEPGAEPAVGAAVAERPVVEPVAEPVAEPTGEPQAEGLRPERSAEERAGIGSTAEATRSEPIAGSRRTAQAIAGVVFDPVAPEARLRGAGAELDPAMRAESARTPAPGSRAWWALGLVSALAAGIATSASLARRRARPMMVADVQRAEDPRRGGLAVCERAPAHRPCGGVRRPVRHLRALPPLEGERRPHGQRDGRARDAGDGRGRRGGALAA
jgi:hypothetical protein